MSDPYTTKQTSLTACNILVTGLIASHSLSFATETNLQEYEQQRLYQTSYDVSITQPSFNQAGNILSEEYENSIDQQFIEAITSFYAQFIEDQEPLGLEFERVLNENIWDLYES